MDCVQFMKHYPDKFFDLAVVDPEYGIDVTGMQLGAGRKKTSFKDKGWDKEPPGLEYFYELFRVSKNQVVWGANHFISRMPYDSKCWIIWDKIQEFSGADFEMAWTSFSSPAKSFRKSRVEAHTESEKIHPTQKPISLYDWIFHKYATKGQKVIDTHLGSQSSRIAAHKNGLDFYGAEIDKEYFDLGCRRYDEFVKQGNLFQMPDEGGQGKPSQKNNTLFDAA